MHESPSIDTAESEPKKEIPEVLVMDNLGELKTPEEAEEVFLKEDRIRRKKAKKGKLSGDASNQPVLVAATAAAAVVGLLIIRRLWRRRKSSAAALLEKGLALPPAASPAKPTSLTGLHFVCSALFDIEGACSKYTTGAPAASSADAVVSLLEAGVHLKGRTSTSELSLGLQGDREEASNPSAPECSVSGCGCGPALMVASGLADIGLGSDHVSGIRVQSAIFGLSGFRPSQGALSSRGMARVVGRYDSAAWLVRDPGLHVKIADAFKLPGGKAAFGDKELLKMVVATEVFALFGETGKQLRRIAMEVAKKWAGVDQAASGLLITFLEKSVPSAASFLAEDGPGEDVLEGIRRATSVLQHDALLQSHGHMLEDPASLRPDTLESLNNAQAVSEEDTEEAQQVEDDTKAAMRQILMGTILVLPSLPSPQPPQGSSEEELKNWEKGTLKLAALATLTGCPQVTLAVPQGEGKPPLGLALLARPKTDQRLAEVAGEVAPMLRAVIQERVAALTPRPEKSSPTHSNAAANDDQSRAEADLEAARAAGNDAFKAGDFPEAIRQYSIGIKLAGGKHSASVPLYSNRALCHIKIGRYQDAELDCTAALQGGPNVKALLRRGTARSLLGMPQEAIKDFQLVLNLEPNNSQAKKELQGLKELRG